MLAFSGLARYVGLGTIPTKKLYRWVGWRDEWTGRWGLAGGSGNQSTNRSIDRWTNDHGGMCEIRTDAIGKKRKEGRKEKRKKRKVNCCSCFLVVCCCLLFLGKSRRNRNRRSRGESNPGNRGITHTDRYAHWVRSRIQSHTDPDTLARTHTHTYISALHGERERDCRTEKDAVDPYRLIGVRENQDTSNRWTCLHQSHCHCHCTALIVVSAAIDRPLVVFILSWSH